MRIIFIILFSLFATFSNAQVLQHNSKLLETIHDTTISLKYFKNADSLLLSKIDSFDLYLMKRKYDYDSNYYYTLNFTLVQRHRCRDEFTIRYNALYDDYNLLLFYMNEKDGRGEYTIPFGFFVYKGRLVICTTTRQDLHLSKESTTLLTNLIFEHVDYSEKKLILGHPQYDIRVFSKPVKRYFLN